MAQDAERWRKALPKQAKHIAKLIEIDAPAMIVANEIAVFVRESSKVYGADLDFALAGILKTLPQQ